MSSVFQAHNRWLKIKSNPELYKKKLEQTRRTGKMYRKKNKDKIREYSNVWNKEMRALDLELGRCTCCHGDRDNLKFVLCSACRLYQREANRKSRSRK